MELSRHASVRKQQRGFQADDIELITKFGTPVRRHGNVVEYQMTQKRKKQSLSEIFRKCLIPALISRKYHISWGRMNIRSYRPFITMMAPMRFFARAGFINNGTMLSISQDITRQR